MSCDVFIVPFFQDNYAYVIRDVNTGKTAVVDPGDPEPIDVFLKDRGWALDVIINTHHHQDHVGGNEVLKKAYGANVVAPFKDAHRIPGMDRGVEEGDSISLGTARLDVFETPGHTRGHIMVYDACGGHLFTGDTVFSLGCGRLFEGTYDDMFQSLNRLRSLPEETRIYGGHEYTLHQCIFARSLYESYPTLLQKLDRYEQACQKKRAEQKPTYPTTLKHERLLNPFLNTDHPMFYQGPESKTPFDLFCKRRQERDVF